MGTIVCGLLCCCLAASGLVERAVAQQTPSEQGHAKGSTRPSTHPDVFLVTIDTLRADHVQCYGYDRVQTPALDSLAKDGVRFGDAFTASPITNSSHATILTGDLPSTHGVSDFAVPLAVSATWAELLKSAGYKTAAFIGAVILDSRSLAPGFDRGFDFYDNFPKHPASTTRWGRVERRGMDVVNHAENWLSTHRAAPRFVWVHLYDPHDPYEPPPPYSQTYKDRLYDGEIAYADSALTHFLNYLKQHGWYNDALIVVVGDHGEGLGEHGEETHGIFLYDSTLHVPLIFKLPGGRSSGTVVPSQVRTVDILPTVLDLLSLRTAVQFDGQSLRSALLQHEASDLPAIGQTDYPLRFGWAPLRSLRLEGFKLVEAPRPEFYDLHADPKELHNTYEPWNPTVQKFRDQLAQVKSGGGKTSAGAVPESTIAELRALGYLGTAGSTNVPQPSLQPDPKDKIEEQNLLHRAMLAADDGRMPDARSALQRLLSLDPESSTALLQLGMLEYKAENYTQAAAYFKQARTLRPDDASAAFHEGEALHKSGDLNGAKEALESSLHLNPSQAAARVLLGQVYLRQKDFKSGQDQFEAAMLLAPGTETHINIARAWLDAGQVNEAILQLQESAKLQAGEAEVYELLAQAYTRAGRKAEAQEASHRARQLRSKADSLPPQAPAN
jgi:arylsulfatase A-like enzyme/Flp pilus assembly protein TadD